MTATNSIKTVCLIGHQLPPFYMDNHPASEALEKVAIDLWNAGFGVLAPHLNAPRAEGLIIPPEFQFNFERRVIHSFADAIFLMPDWEDHRDVWQRAAVAELSQKPIFTSVPQLVRWREGKSNAALRLLMPAHEVSYIKEQYTRIVFVAGKYFVGEKSGDIIIPNRNAIHDNIVAANSVAVRLWQEGIAAFTPHNNTHHFELKTRIAESVYQAFDRCILQLVDAMVLLENWINASVSKK